MSEAPVEAVAAPEAAAPEVAPTTEPTPAPAPEAPPSILDSIQDADLRTYAEGKGFDKAGFEGVVKSYSNLEKMMSADRQDRTVVMPGLHSTPEERAEFFNKLGRPEEPKGYELPVPEGADTQFADWASATFHEAGLSKEQAGKVAEAWNLYAGQQQQMVADQQQVSQVDAEAELRKEWGAAYDQNVKNVDAAASQLGMSPEQLSGLRDSMGSVEAMKFVHGLHSKLGDDTFDQGEPTTPGVMTPEQARQETNALLSNKDFMEAWMNKGHPGHADAVAQKARLSRMMSGELG